MHPTLAMLAILAALLASVAVLVPRLGWIGKLLSRYNARNIVVRWPITAMPESGGGLMSPVSSAVNGVKRPS